MKTRSITKFTGLLCAMALLATIVMPATAGATVIWEDKAPSSYAHDYGGMFAVAGKIYAVGRYRSEGVVNVEEYDPATDTWTTKTALQQDPHDFGSAEVNGKIYVSTNPTGLYAYDPAADSWEAKTPSSNWPSGAAATGFNDKIYVFGQSPESSKTREYDPGTDTWTMKASMPTMRAYAASTVDNGKIYVIGGSNDDGYKSVDQYDPAADTWTAKAPLAVGQDAFSAVTVNGRIYALGGDREYNTVQKYDTQTDTWTVDSAMHFERTWGQIAATIGNKIYTMGGDATKFEVGTIPEVTGNTQATIGPAAELTLNPETLEFGSVSPTVGNYTQTRVATVKSNKNWELFVRKLGDLTGANTADVIPSAQLTFTSAAQASPVEFSLTDTLVNSGAPTAGTDSNVDYALNVGWEDQPDSYSAQHIYTVVQP